MMTKYISILILDFRRKNLWMMNIQKVVKKKIIRMFQIQKLMIQKSQIKRKDQLMMIMILKIPLIFHVKENFTNMMIEQLMKIIK
jgi:hypothetical protein